MATKKKMAKSSPKRNAKAKPKPKVKTKLKAKPKKAAASKTKSTKKSLVAGKKRRKPRIPVRPDSAEVVSYGRRGLGARSGGQSGDTQGISAAVRTDSESVEELLEEGQSFEAEVVAGVENAPEPDQGEVRTKEVPEDDVPDEYREQD